MQESILFENLRYSFKSKNSAQILWHLYPIIDVLRNTSFLDSRLRLHPLGFVYARLFEFENLDTIRFHLWNEGLVGQAPLMDIHNHFYEVSSFVYKGIITNDIYSDSQDPVPTHSVYHGSYLTDNIRVLRRTDIKSSLKIIEQQVILEGNLYSIAKSQIHRGCSISSLSVTFVFTEDPGNPNPLVFGPINGNSEYKFESAFVNKGVLDAVKSWL